MRAAVLILPININTKTMKDKKWNRGSLLWL